MATLYTAKFNINEKIYRVSDGKENLDELLNLIFRKINQEEIVIDDKDEMIKYKFVDLFPDPDSMIINGTIVKIYDGINSSYDEDEDRVVDEEASNKADYVSFSFDIRREIVGFIPKQSFSREAFLKYFRLLVEKCAPEVGATVLILVNDGNALDEKFRRMHILRDIEVLLIPANSDRNDIADLVDVLSEDMKESNAQEVGINLKGTIREPLLKKSKLVNNFKSIAKKAYAKIKATGRDESGSDYEIDSEKDTLLKRTVRDDLKNSVTDIAEVTQEAIGIYEAQKIQEVIKHEREKGEK